MHLALKVQGMLLNIFGYRRLHTICDGYCSDLAVLARTCRIFKELGLDVLWREMANLSPLIKCQKAR